MTSKYLNVWIWFSQIQFVDIISDDHIVTTWPL